MSKALEFVFRVTKYFVYVKSNKKLLGSIIQDETGDWIFWPDKASDGYWEWEAMEEIVNKLKYLNVQEAEKENKLVKEYENEHSINK